jgi:hypothetical protein
MRLWLLTAVARFQAESICSRSLWRRFMERLDLTSDQPQHTNVGCLAGFV